jgi:mono/diheme cytochrome c family protein
MSKRNRKQAAAVPAPERRAPARKAPLAFAVGGVVILGLLVTLFSWPRASSGSLTASASPEHGLTLYKKYCVSCHGPNGRGEYRWQYKERGAPPLDASAHAWHHSDSQLVSMILDKPVPDSRMPPWRSILSRDDAIDIVAYMKTLWGSYIVANCQGPKHMQCMSPR